MLGDGFAIEPTMETVVSPVDGTIISVADTMHAITIKADSGLELLIHLGIDTVELKGEPFSMDVKAGKHVVAGQQLGLMDTQKNQSGRQRSSGDHGGHKYGCRGKLWDFC